VAALCIAETYAVRDVLQHVFTAELDVPRMGVVVDVMVQFFEDVCVELRFNDVRPASSR